MQKKLSQIFYRDLCRELDLMNLSFLGLGNPNNYLLTNNGDFLQYCPHEVFLYDLR